MKLCHLGDLGHDLSAEQIKQIGDVDILLYLSEVCSQLRWMEPIKSARALSRRQFSRCITRRTNAPGCNFPLMIL